MKMLRVDDDVHEIITKLADEEDRGLTAYLNRHFRLLKDYKVGNDEGWKPQPVVVPPDTELVPGLEPLPKNPRTRKNNGGSQATKGEELAAKAQASSDKQFDFCKHGQVKGFCKQGCK